MFTKTIIFCKCYSGFNFLRHLFHEKNYYGYGTESYI